MRRHAADTVVTEALRHLDPAPRTDMTEAERERADAVFARIVATPSDEPVLLEADRPLRRRSRLLVTLGLAGAAGIAIPGVLLGGGTAYGSWTPTPEPSRTWPPPRPPPPAAPSSTCQTGESASRWQSDVANGPTYCSPAPGRRRSA